MDAESIQAFARAGRRRPIFEPAASQAVDLRRGEIETLLPHRDPFLFVDRVTALDPSLRAATGTRRIDPMDPVFRGHFPGEPIYPGVLQLEIMGQLGLCLLALTSGKQSGADPERRALKPRALKIHHAVFLAAVLPGDELAISAKVLESDELTSICAGQIARAATICAFAVMEVYFVDS